MTQVEQQLRDIRADISNVKTDTSVIVSNQEHMMTEFARHENRLDEHAKRIHILEMAQSAGIRVGGIVERAFWIAVTAVVGMVAYLARHLQ